MVICICCWGWLENNNLYGDVICIYHLFLTKPKYESDFLTGYINTYTPYIIKMKPDLNKIFTLIYKKNTVAKCWSLM